MHVLAIEYILLTASALSMFWAGFTLVRKGLSRPYEYALLVFLSGVFGWSLALLLTLFTGHVVFAHGAFLSAPIGLIGLTSFALTFPDKRISRAHVLFFIPTILACILATSPHLLVRSLTVHSDGYLSIERGIFHVVYSILISLGGILPTGILLYRLQHSFNPLMRQKFFWFISVMTGTIVASICTNVILPNFFDFPKLNSAGPIFSTSLASIIVFLVLQEYYVNIRWVIASFLSKSIRLGIGCTIGFFTYVYFLRRTEDALSSVLLGTGSGILFLVLARQGLRFARNRQVRMHVHKEDTPLPNDIIQQLALATSYDEVERLITHIVHQYIALDNIRLFTATTCPVHIGKHIARLSDIRTSSTHTPPIYTHETIVYGIPESEMEHKKIAHQALESIGAEILIPVLFKEHIIGILTGTLGKKTRLSAYHDIHFLTSLANVLSPLLLRIGAIEQLREEKVQLSSRVKILEHEQREEKTERKRYATAYIAKFREYFLLLSTQQSQNREKHTSLIEQSQATIHGLIDLIRIQSTIIPVHEKYNLNTILAHAQKECTQHMECTLSIESAIMHGNGALLKRALLEILKNAAEHPRSHIQAKTWMLANETQEHVRIMIEDNGIGIPEMYFSLLGTPLLDIHKEKATKGVGLAIAHHIIRAHHGTITYNRSTHGGLCVCILLPKTHPI